MLRNAMTAAEHDTHTKAYIAIWAVLLVLLIVSIGLGHIPNPYLMNALVFSVAGIKAILVVRYFMHLKLEPWLVAIMLIAGVATLGVLLLGVAPDVTFSPTTGGTSL